MANEKKINAFFKHKRLIIIGLVLIGLIVMIILTYILTYTSNLPKAFKEDKANKELNIVKKCDYFKFDCVATDIHLTKDSKSPYIKVVGEISNVTETITNVTVKFEMHNKWTSKDSYTSDSDHKFNSGNPISATTTSTFESTSANMTLTNSYPLKVLPLVRVKSPIIYAKVTYTRKLPDSAKGKGGNITEVVFYTFTYNDYVTSRTVFN